MHFLKYIKRFHFLRFLALKNKTKQANKNKQNKNKNKTKQTNKQKIF